MVKFKSKLKVSYIFIVLLVFGLGMVSLDKDFHLVTNSYHTWYLDYFFKYVTHLGDGLLFPFFALLFLFIKKKQSARFAIAGVFTLLITSLMKKVIFKGLPRPIEYFGEEHLYLIEGVKMCHWNTFPSGHSMSAFAIFTLLYFYIKNKKLKYGMLIVASVASYSRVYLSQHFLLDVIVGSMIGFGIAKLSIVVVASIFKSLKRKKKSVLVSKLKASS